MNQSKKSADGKHVILMFVENFAATLIVIRDQLNCNSVTLGTKTDRIAKNRLELLKERLTNCHKYNKEYVLLVDDYNKELHSF